MNIFLVVAHGDEASNDSNRELQAMLAGARASAINSFYAEHSSLQFHELIHTFVEPIKHESHEDEAGRVWVVIEGFASLGMTQCARSIGHPTKD